MLILVHSTTRLNDTNGFVKRQVEFQPLPLDPFRGCGVQRGMLYFELLCGASGDMILASLVDLGIPLSYLEDNFRSLQIPGLAIGQSHQTRAGRSCLQLAITWSEESQQEYRNLASILALLERGKYSTGVVETCRGILGRLAQAESRVHGVPVDQVHFLHKLIWKN